MISESYSEFMAARHYVYNFAASMDLSSFGAGLDSDGVKLNAGPMAKEIADRAMQV
jgi:isovaleryl-CoA dehydrogenase